MRSRAGSPCHTDETVAQRRARARKIIRALRKLYPEADCALNHDSAFQLLVTTILSAQSTDRTVNEVAPKLFARYPTAQAIADAVRGDVEGLIHATGFFRQKAKSLQGSAQRVVQEFGGQVPNNMADLLTLPGVARKTANVVLGTWFKRNEGMVVDTHIGRLAHRMALTWKSKDSKDALRIEKDLMEILPQKEWAYMGHALIWHGRRVCTARKPACNACALSKHCPSAGTFD